MKLKCSFPDCDKSQEVSFLVWLFACLSTRSLSPYLCKEHRFTEQEWDDLYAELKQLGKIS